MILQSHAAFDTLAEYSTETGDFALFSRGFEPARVASAQPAGIFGHLAGQRVMLYRWCGMLYLQIADLQLPMDRHVVELRSDNINRTLRVLADGAVVCELRYNVQPLDPPLLDDPTPFIEDEDFDFGLLLANVSQDNTRQQRMFAES